MRGSSVLRGSERVLDQVMWGRVGVGGARLFGACVGGGWELGRGHSGRFFRWRRI